MSRLLKIFLAFLLICLSFGYFLHDAQKAYGACTINPTLTNIGATDGDWSVTYHLRLTDNCAGTNTYNVRVINLPIQGSWKIENAGTGNTYTVSVTGSKDIDVTVTRDKNVYQANGSYSPVTVRASLASNSGIRDDISMNYIVQNKPDLEVSEFSFPDGCTGATVAPKVKIKNTGWAATSGSFWVRVQNGAGDLEDVQVTQSMAHNKEIDLSSKFLNKFTYPPAGTYIAKAIVDQRKQIAEQDSVSESNNTKTDSYKSNACNNPTPTKIPALTPTPTIPAITPTPVPGSEAWFHGIGGDVRADNGIVNHIPAGNYFSESDLVLSPGVVFGSFPFDLGGNQGNQAAKSNNKSWLVSDVKYSFPVVETSYAQTNFTLNRGSVPRIQVFGNACSGGGPTCNLIPNLPRGLYVSNNRVEINTPGQYTFAPNSNYIFLIDDDLVIKSDLIIPHSSTVIFIVSGDIIIDPSVGHIEGIYSTDNNFVVNGASSGPDIPLTVEGSIIVNAALKPFPGTIKRSRDLGVANASTPIIKVIYRPDFVLNAPALIRYTNYTRHEVAPGQ